MNFGEEKPQPASLSLEVSEEGRSEEEAFFPEKTKGSQADTRL